MIGLIMKSSHGTHQFQASGKYNTPLLRPRHVEPGAVDSWIPAGRTCVFAGSYAGAQSADNCMATTNVHRRLSTTSRVIIGTAPAPGAARPGPETFRSCHECTPSWRESSCYRIRPACIQFQHQGIWGETHVE